jgi:hypothetical protein
MPEDVTAEAVARVIAAALAEAFPGAMLGTNTSPNSRDGRVVMRTRDGQDYSVRVREE